MRRVVSSHSGSPRTPWLHRAAFAAVGRTGDSSAVRVFGFKARGPMTIARRVVTGLMAVLALCAFGAAAASADSLYISDGVDNTITTFDARTGAFQNFIGPPPTGVSGPRGVIHLSNGNLLVAYQNPGGSTPGEIDRFATNGTFRGSLVPSTDAHPPFAPRGIILGPDNRTLYVADFGKGNVGAIETYDVETGKFLGKLNFDKWANSSTSNREFHPNGVVFGPDGRLYISLFSEKDFQHLGWIISYDIGTGTVRLIAQYNPSATDCTPYLSRPFGLTFGADRNLYVVGRQPSDSTNDTDKLLAFKPTATGPWACASIAGQRWIDLDQPGQPPTYARSLLFGPGGYLYLPMTGSGGDAGAVRQYNLTTGQYTDFVPPFTSPSGGLADWWWMTFGYTNPTTLAYQPAS